MSLILSGTDGLSDVDGSAATPAIRGTDTNTGIFFPAVDTIAFAEGGAEAMRINSSGNVSIGMTGGTGVLNLNNATVPNFRLYVNGTLTTDFYASGTDTTLTTVTNGSLAFGTNNTERMRITAAGLLQFNSGYGSVATAYGCRAWVNFNGTGTVAIRASGNVSSITDNGTGDYTVNYTTAMPDANYSVVGTAQQNTGSFGAAIHIHNSVSPTTGAARLTWIQGNGSSPQTDSAMVCVAVFR
jgi:hypothetical protein